MAKQELYRTAQQSAKLFKLINESQELETWVQEKITKAAEDISTVYQYLNYEKQFQDYSKMIAEDTTLSEGKKAVLSTKLMEAKEKVKELKKKAAKEKAEKKADKVEEGQEDLKKTGDSYKTARGGTVTKTATGVKHEKGDYSDEDHVEPAQKKASKAGLTGAERQAQKAKDKEQDKQSKDWEKKYPGSVTRHKMDENDKGDMDNDGTDEPDDEEYKQNKDVAIKKAMGKKEKKTDEGAYLGKAVAEGKKCPICKKDPCKCGKGSAKTKKVEEGSTGDYSAKKGAAGKDLGKPGKNFDKIAKDAAGRGGKKVAGAVLKNLRKDESVKKAIAKAKDMLEGKKKGDGNLANNAKPYDKVTKGDVVAGRLGKDEEGGKKKVVKESFELDRIKAITTRLLG